MAEAGTQIVNFWRQGIDSWAPLDGALGQAARDTATECPRYRWLGGLPHESTRRHIQRAHVLVHASRMEGGAHVVMEAVRCGTPVLASRIPGNVGMLGADYDGYFEPGDSAGLARLLRRCQRELPWPGSSGFLALGAVRAPELNAVTDCCDALLRDAAALGALEAEVREAGFLDAMPTVLSALGRMLGRL